MSKYLVIVESPAKAKTIKKYLGTNYEVIASMGHVRDLPKSQMGIDVEHDYEPKYITIRGKGDLLQTLRKAVKKSDKGEAISWHLVNALKLEEGKYKRITFNEITKTAVKNAIKSPRDIDMDLVDAQQARRVLDRMVGYSISPLLWKKVKRGLSAGRVQSAALKLIYDREEKINDFIPEEYWTLDAYLLAKGVKKPVVAKFLRSALNKAFPSSNTVLPLKRSYTMLLILFFAARPNLEEISLNTPKSSLIIACRVKLNVRPSVNTLTFVPASLI